MDMHNMNRHYILKLTKRQVDRRKDLIGTKDLEEAIDLFTGDMTRWTLRDVEVSNGSLLVSHSATVLDC
jgi:hypothetical protein